MANILDIFRNKEREPVELVRFINEFANKSKRHNGQLPATLTSQQNFNKRIKNICRQAKITTLTTIEFRRGNKIEKCRRKKYEMVGSHTARRSFATNMYLAGVQTAKIMMLTGHKTEDAFFRYIRIGKAENAKELADHPFFRKNN